MKDLTLVPFPTGKGCLLMKVTALREYMTPSCLPPRGEAGGGWFVRVDAQHS
jgi:hypothetical protein